MIRPIEKHTLIGLASGKRGQLVCLPDGTVVGSDCNVRPLNSRQLRRLLDKALRRQWKNVGVGHE